MAQDPSNWSDLIITQPSRTWADPQLSDENVSRMRSSVYGQYANRAKLLNSQPNWRTDVNPFVQLFGDTIKTERNLATGEFETKPTDESSLMGRYMKHKWSYTTGMLNGFMSDETPDPDFVWDGESWGKLSKEIPARYHNELYQRPSLQDAEKFVSRINSDEEFLSAMEGMIHTEREGLGDELWRFSDQWVLPMTDPIPLVGSVLVDRGASLVARIGLASRAAKLATTKGSFVRGMGIHAAAEGLWGATFTAMADAGSPYVEDEDYAFNIALAGLLGGAFGGLEHTGFMRNALERVAVKDGIEMARQEAMTASFQELRLALKAATDPAQTDPRYTQEVMNILSRHDQMLDDLIGGVDEFIGPLAQTDRPVNLNKQLQDLADELDKATPKEAVGIQRQINDLKLYSKFTVAKKPRPLAPLGKGRFINQLDELQKKLDEATPEEAKKIAREMELLRSRIDSLRQLPRLDQLLSRQEDLWRRMEDEIRSSISLDSMRTGKTAKTKNLKKDIAALEADIKKTAKEIEELENLARRDPQDAVTYRRMVKELQVEEADFRQRLNRLKDTSIDEEGSQVDELLDAVARGDKEAAEMLNAERVDWLLRHPEGREMLQSLYDEVEATYEAILMADPTYRGTPDMAGTMGWLSSTHDELTLPFMRKLDFDNQETLDAMLEGAGNVGTLSTDEVLNVIPSTATKSIDDITEEIRLTQKKFDEAIANSVEKSRLGARLADYNATLRYRQNLEKSEEIEKNIKKLNAAHERAAAKLKPQSVAQLELTRHHKAKVAKLRNEIEVLAKEAPDPAGVQARTLRLISDITNGHAGFIGINDLEFLSRQSPATVRNLELKDLVNITAAQRQRAKAAINIAQEVDDKSIRVGRRLKKKAGDLVVGPDGRLGLVRAARDEDNLLIIDYDDLTPRTVTKKTGDKETAEYLTDTDVDDLLFGGGVLDDSPMKPDLRADEAMRSRVVKTKQGEVHVARTEDLVKFAAASDALFPTTPLKTIEHTWQGNKRLGIKFSQSIMGFDVEVSRLKVGGKRRTWAVRIKDSAEGARTQRFMLDDVNKAEAMAEINRRIREQRVAQLADPEFTMALRAKMGLLRGEEGFEFLHSIEYPEDPLIRLSQYGDLPADWYTLTEFGDANINVNTSPRQRFERASELERYRAAGELKREAEAARQAQAEELGEGITGASETVEVSTDNVLDDAPRLHKFWKLVSLGGYRSKMLSHDLGIVRAMASDVLGSQAALHNKAGQYFPAGQAQGLFKNYNILADGAKAARRTFVTTQLNEVRSVYLPTVDEFVKHRNTINESGVGKRARQAITGNLASEFDHMIARYIKSDGKILPTDPAEQALVKKAAAPIQKKFRELLEMAQDAEIRGFENIDPDPSYFTQIMQTGKMDSFVNRVVMSNGRSGEEQMEDFLTDVIMKGEEWSEESSRIMAKKLYTYYTVGASHQNTAQQVASMAKGNAEETLDGVEKWLREGMGEDSTFAFTAEERAALLKDIGITIKKSKRTMYRVKLDPTTTKKFKFTDGSTKEIYITDLFEEQPGAVLDRYASDIFTLIQTKYILDKYTGPGGKRYDTISELMEGVVTAAKARNAVTNIQGLKNELKVLENDILGKPQFHRSSLGSALSVLRSITGNLRVPGFVKTQLPETTAAAVSGGFSTVLDSMPVFNVVREEALAGTLKEATVRDFISFFLGMGDAEAEMALMYNKFELMSEGQPLFGDGKMGRAYEVSSRMQPRVGYASNYSNLNIYGDMWAFSSFMNRMSAMARTGDVADFVGRKNVRIATLGQTREGFDELMDALSNPGVIKSETVNGITLDRINVDALSPEMQARFRSMSTKWVKQVMQRSDVLDRPQGLVTNEMGDFFTQFKAFAITSQTNHFARNVQLRDSLAAQTLMAQMVGAIGVSIALAYLYYWDEPEKLKEALSTEGLLKASTRKTALWGMMPDLTDSVLWGLGRIGLPVEPIFTNMHEPTLVNFPSMSTLADAGKVPGTVFDAFKQGHLDQKQYRSLMRMVPMANAWYSSIISNTLIEPLLPKPQQ